MFPLSETALLTGAFAACLALLSLALYALARVSKAAAVWLAGALSCVLLVLIVGSNPFYDASTGFVLTLFAFCLAPLLSLLWVLLVRRWGKPFAVSMALAVLPALAIAGYFIERQIVPDAVCSQSHVPLEIGGAPVQLRPEFAGRISVEGAIGFLDYDRRARNKEDMRKLCDLSAGGSRSIAADWASLSLGLYPEALTAACSAQVPPAFCDGFRAEYLTDIGAFVLMRRDARTLRYELGRAGRSDTAFEGDATEGHLCERGEAAGMTRHCRMWRSLGSNAVVLLTSKRLRDPVEMDEALAQMDAALAFFLRASRP